MSKQSASTARVRSGGGSGVRAGSRQTAKRSRAADGLETGADGSVIGRDPRRLSPLELRALGHRGKPLPQAMRRRCIDCCGGKKDEVRRCTAVACPLWPYRMGTDPWQAEAKQAASEHRPAALAPASSVATARQSPRRMVLKDMPLMPFFDDVPE